MNNFIDSISELQCSILRVSIALDALKLEYPEFDFDKHDKFISMIVQFSRINLDKLDKIIGN